MKKAEQLLRRMKLEEERDLRKSAKIIKYNDKAEINNYQRTTKKAGQLLFFITSKKK